MTIETGRTMADGVETDLRIARAVNEKLQADFARAAQEFDELKIRATNDRAAWLSAKARVEQLTIERDKLRASVEPLRAEISKTHKALNSKAEECRFREENVLAANRKAAAAEQRFVAMETTFGRMQRARDAADVAYGSTLRELDAAKAELAGVWAKASELAKEQVATRDLLSRIRNVMPADLAQVKNEAFRKLLLEVEGMGIKPKLPAKAV